MAPSPYPSKKFEGTKLWAFLVFLLLVAEYVSFLRDPCICFLFFFNLT